MHTPNSNWRRTGAGTGCPAHPIMSLPPGRPKTGRGGPGQGQVETGGHRRTISGLDIIQRPKSEGACEF